ncbi:Hypothetical Protein FCC1311_066792 [Hondaea fermentalgiana]|uniref:Uncharacterized protein n=1 Tax=Hondaea fermentalgiana TaxID=2315210 RepID=A0A2R5GHU7_9STRA|nr:Hypothetical Protein FCC1311_066792 [Hondaea fermentalgiana]|eukprot:GBG30460.1 Hypothetical Protein FCC1311_066792 [Hondaea fermentalgiana]
MEGGGRLTLQALLKLVLVSERARAETERALEAARAEQRARAGVLETSGEREPAVRYRPARLTPRQQAALDDAESARDAQVETLRARLEFEEKTIAGYKEKIAALKAGTTSTSALASTSDIDVCTSIDIDVCNSISIDACFAGRGSFRTNCRSSNSLNIKCKCRCRSAGHDESGTRNSPGVPSASLVVTLQCLGILGVLPRQRGLLCIRDLLQFGTQTSLYFFLSVKRIPETGQLRHLARNKIANFRAFSHRLFPGHRLRASFGTKPSCLHSLVTMIHAFRLRTA